MSVERIEQCFAKLREQKRTALVAYLTIGDPSVDDSVACALAALNAGADILEIGVPFSDPTADGPVIAAASYRAIKTGGSLRSALRACELIRERSSAPLVLFTYYNPIVAFGEEQAIDAAARAGVDGFLIVDLPPEEGPILRAAARDKGLAVIPLVAPTTGPEREPKVLRGASGFIYYVSVTGVTGTKAAPLAEAGREAAALSERAKLPVVVGFGIRSADDARTAAKQGVAGVVVGTAIVQAIAGASGGRDARVRAVEELVRSLRAGLDEVARAGV